MICSLGLLLVEMKAEGLPHIEITMDADNVASEKVVRANGGQFVERFSKPAQYGEAEALRYRIAF
jgi:predicted acetyltransferase